MQHLLEKELAFTAEVREIPGLQVEDAQQFRREGVQNLFAVVDEICKPMLGQPEPPVVLNVTGGFKSVVPYLTLYGLINRLPVIYIFERSRALITLPPAPISFDYERLSRARDAILRLHKEGAMPKESFFKLIPRLSFHERDYFETLLEEENAYVTPSAFAMLLFSQREAEQPEVMLSPNAGKAYETASGLVREQFTFMLERVKDPLWRSAKIHPCKSTDLSISKPGNTSERMLYYIGSGRIYVCELAQHAEYEKLISLKKIRDYPAGSFTTWGRPQDMEAPPDTDEEFLVQIRRKLTNSEQRQSELSENMKLCKNELLASQSLLNEQKECLGRLELEERDLSARVQELEAQARLIQSALGDRDRKIVWLRMPWWRRMFTKEPVSSLPHTGTEVK